MQSEFLWTTVDDWERQVTEDTSSVYWPTSATAQQTTATVIAQQFEQDILGDLGNIFSTFVQSGQIWALIIGFILGYLLRSVTSYN